MATKVGKSERRKDGRQTGSQRIRLTVQLSDALIDAIEARADLEAMPNAVFIRRAVKNYVRRPPTEAIEVKQFAEDERRGERGPLRQWPKGVSYVIDEDIARDLTRMAADRSKAGNETVTVADLTREAIVRDLGGPSFPTRPLARDEFGFTTSGADERGRAAQRVMDDAWKATSEE